LEDTILVLVIVAIILNVVVCMEKITKAFVSVQLGVSQDFRMKSLDCIAKRRGAMSFYEKVKLEADEIQKKENNLLLAVQEDIENGVKYKVRKTGYSVNSFSMKIAGAYKRAPTIEDFVDALQFISKTLSAEGFKVSAVLHDTGELYIAIDW